MLPEEWRLAVDEKLRIREYDRAGYEPLDGISLALAKQVEVWEAG